MITATGNLQKMKSEWSQPVIYTLTLGEKNITLNDCLTHTIRIEYLNEIYCVQCNRKTVKSFQQGHCFPCYRHLLECNLCTIHPERCRHYEGCCHHDHWAHVHCSQNHVIYLANSSGLKVGITRATQIPTRWIDQGASQGLIIMTANNRYQAGILEMGLKKFVADKTNWRTMLTTTNNDLDLYHQRDEIYQLAEKVTTNIVKQYPSDEIKLITDGSVTNIQYPVISYPEKIKSLDLEKQNIIEGKLLGIKGQYLMLTTGVINLRKFSGYKINFSVK